jgi:hypothetical protein
MVKPGRVSPGGYGAKIRDGLRAAMPTPPDLGLNEPRI